MTNNQKVRFVNRLIARETSVRHPLFPGSPYEIYFVCSPLRLMVPVVRLTFRKGQFFYRSSHFKGWQRFFPQSFLIDSDGRLILDVS
jgi:hypothetical protein